MDIEYINRAADAYLENAQGAAAARLEFLKGLWALQAALADSAPEYAAAEAGIARDALATGQPLFLASAPEVPADAYVDAIARIVAYILGAGVLNEIDAEALARADFASVITDATATSALRDFDGFVTDVCTTLSPNADGVSKAAVAFVLHSALVPFLTGAAAASLEALGEMEWTVWGSGNCPVCGAAATMGRLSESTKLKGAERTLWCSQCHTEWTYERLRCVRCGSRAQDKLRYTYEENDPAHRLHLCDECHGYIKVTVVDDLTTPLSMPVEDAASITLDAIAHANGYSPTGARA